MDNVQTVYPLSPMQQGMLFHSLHEPESGDYVRQLSLVLEGDVDAHAFRSAWSNAVARHAALRTAFLWEGVAAPVQVVFKEGPLEWNDYAGDEVSEDRRASWAASIAEADLARGFDLRRAPLMRCTLIDLGNGRSQFVWSFHHIVLDGWSVPLLLREVLEDYQALRAGRTVQRQPPPAYRDYIVWLKRQDEAAAQAFWRKYLEGVESATPLGLDHPAGGERRHDECWLRLDTEASTRLRKFARDNRLTVNTVLQGAWALLLSRYSRSADVVFGSVVSGRPPALAQSGEMLGLFINSLPVRVRIPAAGSVVDWLRELQIQQSETVPFEFSPLAKVREWSGLPAAQPLFESLLVFENYPSADAFGSSGLSVREVRSFERTNYPLTLTVDVSDSISILLSYDAARFDRDAIDRMAGHIEAVLEAMAANPQAPPESLPVMTARERARLAEWNATDVPYDVDRPVMAFIEEQVSRTPDAEALVFEGQRLTYRDLNERANKLAGVLRRRGVRPESLVGVCMERSVEMVVSLWAVMKAGGAYVPFDPEYPHERLALLECDTEAAVILTQQRLRSLLDGFTTPVVAVDAEWPTMQGEDGANRPATAGPRNLAYVIYTSGSTGQPKGAMNEHRALSNRLQWMQDEYRIGPGDRVLQKTPFSFDVSVWEFFWPFMAGATLVVAGPGGHRDPDYLARVIREEGVTTLHFVPSMLEVFLQAESSRHCASLRRVICSGEALPFELQERFFERFGNTELHNLYGPTEAAIDVTYWACRPGSSDRTVPIGRPIANTQIHILDERMRPVPIGAPGELHIGGVGVGRGYLNRPELTAAKFASDSIGPEAREGRLYKTGDLARYRPDGAIEYLGRLDHQVKIRGLRIELGEIESDLRKIAGVRECVVVAREDDPGDKRLVAYFTGEAGLSAEDLRAKLRLSLPEYMVPSAFVHLEALPVSLNGKVDRRALPKPEGTSLSSGRPFVAPSTPGEETLAEIWAAVLRAERVGVHDNFFDLGGDSILSIRVVSRAAQAGLRISTRLLFENPTIAQLAPLATSAGAPQAEQGLVSGPVPFTPIQRWFVEQDLPEPHHFNQAALLDCGTRVDAAALERALRALVAHHDALRLRLIRPEDGDGWRQENAPVETALFFSVLEDADEQAKTILQASLDLTQGPLLRAALIDRGPDVDQQLLLVIHHWAVDGVSWRILLEDIEASYRAAVDSQPIRLPSKTTSFQQWAIELDRHAESEDVQATREFWKSAVEAKPARISPDLPGAAGTVASERTVRRRVQQEEAASPQLRTQEALLAAVLSAVGGERRSEVRIDVEGHGRDPFSPSVDVSRTVGWFTSIFPVKIDLAAPDLVAEVKARLEESSRRSLSFGLLRYAPVPQDGFGASDYEPSKILFNYLGHFGPEEQSPLFRLTSGDTGRARGLRNARAYEIECHVFALESALEFVWTYNHELHRPQTIERIADACTAALRSLTVQSAGAAPKPSDFPLVDLSQEQIDRLSSFGAISSIRPLSPLQHGMLFESVYEGGRGANIEQLSCRFVGELDLDAFAQAWYRVCRRYESLRTAFFWQDLSQPIQVSFEEPSLEVRRLDWTNLSAGEIESRLSERLREDRVARFDLSRLPLMRLDVARLADGSHQFLWTWHHVIMDGWCLPLVLGDVFALYRAQRTGAAPKLNPARSYGDYLVWLSAQDRDAALQFWTRELEGFAEPTPIGIAAATVRPVETGQTSFRLRQTNLSAKQTEELAAFARRSQLTLSTLVQGAWALLLSRYGRQEDVLFGAVVSGRPEELAGVESMVGLFANTLPFRVKVNRAVGVEPWLRQLQQKFLEMRAFEYSQLAEVQRVSEVPAGRLLFTSLVAFENYPIDEAVVGASHELQITETKIHEQPEIPLSLVAAPGQELSLGLLYDESIYDAVAIDRALGHMQNLLMGLADAACRTLGDIPMLGGAEEMALRERWNKTLREYPRETSVATLFSVQAESTPTRVAVYHGDDALTFGELHERSNRLANYLRKRGIAKGDVVGICLDRGLDLIVGLLAIAKTGAAYLPLDADYPSDRLRFMIEDSGARLLVSDGKHLHKLSAAAETALVLVDRDAASVSAESSAPPADPCSGGDLLYVMYTSGSTGRPKGIDICHRGVTRLVKNTDYIQWEPGDRVAQASNVSFDAATFEIWGALLNGVGLTIVDRERMLDPESFGAWLKSEKVTVLFLTTALFNQMARADSGGLTGLRVLLFGGEAVDMRSVRQAWTSNRPEHLLHVYGPTEATTFATWRELTDQDVAEGVPPAPIGLPIANTELYLLDAVEQLVPLGVPGEICLGGDGLALGYRGRPELTAEKFIDHPWRPGEKLYRTGDLGIRRPDGAIEFAGRIDDQVKIRGFRIELGEIETALRSLAGVEDAIVLVHEDDAANKRLIAYAAIGERQLDGAEIRNSLKSRLPEYMIPAVIVTVDKMPLNANGKVDRAALPSPSWTAKERPEEGPVVLTEPQQLLIDIWRELLSLQHVGLDDNFFEIGGDSILTIQIVSRANRAGIPLTARGIFEHQTIRAISAALGTSADGSFALTPPQRWLVSNGLGGEASAGYMLLADLSPDADPDRVCRALRDAVRRFDVLLHRLDPDAGRWFPHGGDPESLVTRCTLGPGDELQEWRGILEGLAASLNPVQGRLVRCAVIERESEPQTLAVVVHDLVADSASLEAILRAIHDAYEETDSQRQPPLAASKVAAYLSAHLPPSDSAFQGKQTPAGATATRTAAIRLPDAALAPWNGDWARILTSTASEASTAVWPHAAVQVDTERSCRDQFPIGMDASATVNRCLTVVTADRPRGASHTHNIQRVLCREIIDVARIAPRRVPFDGRARVLQQQSSRPIPSTYDFEISAVASSGSLEVSFAARNGDEGRLEDFVTVFMEKLGDAVKTAIADGAHLRKPLGDGSISGRDRESLLRRLSGGGVSRSSKNDREGVAK